MDKETKEILDRLNQIATENKESKNPLICTLISFEVLYKLLDCITNLQKTKKKANEYLKKHTNNFVEYLDVYEVKELSNILDIGDDNE